MTNRFLPLTESESGALSRRRTSVTDEATARGSRERGKAMRRGKKRSTSLMSVENTPLFQQYTAEGKVDQHEYAD